MSTPPPENQHPGGQPPPTGWAPPPPGEPPAGWAPPPPPRPQKPTLGALPWGLGLTVFLCFPFVSSVIASVAMAATGRALRDKEWVVAENGRRAANWGLTYLLLTVLLVGGHFTLLFALTHDGGSLGFFPFGLIITSWVVISIAHVGFSIAGLVCGLRGKVLRVSGIPFFVASSVRRDDEPLLDD